MAASAGTSLVGMGPADADVLPNDPSASSRSKDFSFKRIHQEGRLLSYSILMGAMGFCWLSVSIASSYLAPWFLENGLSSMQAGIILATQPIANVLVQPLIPCLGEKCGQINMLIWGVLTSAVSLVFLGLAPTLIPAGGMPMFVLLLCTSTLAGIGEGITETTVYTLIQDVFPDFLGQVTGHCEAFVGLGIVGGPPIGGFAFSLGGFFVPPAICAFLLALVGVAAAVWKCKRAKDVADGTADDEEEEEGSRKPDKVVFLTAILAIITACFITGAYEPLMSTHFVEDYGWSNSAVGVVFAAYGATYVTFSIQSGKWADSSTRSPRILMCTGLFISGTGCALIATPWIPVGILGILFLGVADGFSIVAGLTLLVQAVHEGAKPAWTSAVLSGCCAIGLGLGPLLSVPLSDAFGLENVLNAFAVMAVAVGLFCVIVLCYRPLPDPAADNARAPKVSLGRTLSRSNSQSR